MQNLYQAVPQSQPANQKLAKLPYDALEARCPKCRAYAGSQCVSSRRKRIRYPHHQRTELAASEFRSEVRRQILDHSRRHPFAQAFSQRRMAVEGFCTRQEFEGPRRHGGREEFAAPGDCYAEN